jgi:hypothetical protein
LLQLLIQCLWAIQYRLGSFSGEHFEIHRRTCFEKLDVT